MHRYYRIPADAQGIAIPATLTSADGVAIEVNVVGSMCLHPAAFTGDADLGIPPGQVYSEVEPWPESLMDVPDFPLFLFVSRDTNGDRRTRTEPLPETLAPGDRNTCLFREGCRLRRLGWNEQEIAKALLALNSERCRPPLEPSEVEAIARSCAKYQPAADTFPTTETGDAELFADCNRDVVRYDHRRGRWLLFDGTIWAPQTHGEIARLALDAIRGRQHAAIGDKDRMKWAVAGEARKRQTNLLAIAQNIEPLADAGDSWDTDPWLLGAPNGVIDLRTGTLRPGRPEDRITMRVRVPFDPTATCSLYDKTVAEIFTRDTDGTDTLPLVDDELVAYVDRQVGYSLTGDCREESLALCYGDGANGKGTMLNTIGWLLGDYADDLPFSAFELHSRSGIR